MPQALESMNDQQLRDLITVLAQCAAPWSIDGTLSGIDAVGAELVRRGALASSPSAEL
jgi:hypothetical protein